MSDSAEKLLLVLRDGRKLIGVLRSWDQFGISNSFSLTFEIPSFPDGANTGLKQQT